MGVPRGSKERQLTEGKVDASTSVGSRMNPRSTHMIGVTKVASWTLTHVDSAI